MREAHNKGKTKIQPGQVYGDLTVLERVIDDKKSLKWLCQCSCGVVKAINGSNVVTGRSQSCGCKQMEKIKAKLIRHGKTDDPIYAVWNAMLGRCHNEKNKQYKDYGARGIYVCDRWKLFDNFYADMGDPPLGGMLERVNNDGPYSRENCKWATRTEQNRNKRNTRRFPFKGEQLTLGEISDRIGITRNTLTSRIYQHGWPLEMAFNVPVMGAPNAAKYMRDHQLTTATE